MQRMNGQERDVAERADHVATAGVGVNDAEVERRLQALVGTKAPPSLLPAVLVQVGLANAYAQIDAPIGPVYVAYSRHGISALRRAGDLADFERWFGSRFGCALRPVAALPSALAQSVAEQLHGGRRSGVPLDLRGLPEFERAVLRKALEIPRGEVRPYAWVAREIGRPRAARAVGKVLASNPVPLLIPCHRVVRSDGRVGDYAFGPAAKCAMLEAEGLEILNGRVSP